MLKRGPLQCGMQIYENIMQISIVPVFLNKQMTGKRMITLPSGGSWLHLKGCWGVFVYVYGVCVCLQCVCAYVYVCVCKGDRGEAMRSECFKEISTSTTLLCPETRNALLCQGNNYYWDERRLDVCSAVQKEEAVTWTRKAECGRARRCPAVLMG